MFSKRAEKAKASEIRELLKLTEQADVISFGGGLPAPEAFPKDKLSRTSQKVLTTILFKPCNMVQLKAIIN